MTRQEFEDLSPIKQFMLVMLIGDSDEQDELDENEDWSIRFTIETLEVDITGFKEGAIQMWLMEPDKEPITYEIVKVDDYTLTLGRI